MRPTALHCPTFPNRSPHSPPLIPYLPPHTHTLAREEQGSLVMSRYLPLTHPHSHLAFPFLPLPLPLTPPPHHIHTQLLREKQGNLTMINRVMADKQAAAQQQQGRPQGVGGV